jgi:hypothetical protein
MLKGMATFIPGVKRSPGKGSMGGNVSARYCYSVWLRHLVTINSKIPFGIPLTIAEIGPGESLGTGIAALISGADSYYTFDSVRLTNPGTDQNILEELIQLFQNEEDIPGPDEFPLVKPFLASYEFPKSILSTRHLKEKMLKLRLENIRQALANSENKTNPIRISYRAPDYNLKDVADNQFDLIFSQTALEYIPDLEIFYKQCYQLLKSGGVMSHQIDFTSMGLSQFWDGHWTYSDFEWKLIRGRKRCIINREPYSKHRDSLLGANFNITLEMKRTSSPNFNPEQLAKPFRKLSDDDLTTTGAYILAVKS